MDKDAERRAKNAAYQRKSRKKHRDKIAATRRLPENRAKAREYNRQRYLDGKTNKGISWYKRFPEKARLKRLRWRAANKPKLAAARRRQRMNNPRRLRSNGLKWRYGITIEQRDEMLAAQGNCCAICKSPEPGMSYDWHTDHDHQTGRVRGILCAHCNRLLGAAKDSIEVLKAAIVYLGGKERP